jgi:N6-adenosine-specific RNA methylase IME4/transposase
MNIDDLKIHPFAAMFPMMTDHELAGLAVDIKQNGQQNPVTLWRGNILLDGRNRIAACKRAGIEPHFDVYEGNNPIRFIVSQNVQRRNMNLEQRALIAAGLYHLAVGKISAGLASKVSDLEITWGTLADHDPMSQKEAAEVIGVSLITVARAVAILEKGAPDLIEAVREGRMSIARAYEIATTMPAEEQAEISKLPEQDIIDTHERHKRDQKRTDTLRRVAEAAEKGSAEWPTGKRYAVILADPPWRFEVWNRDTGLAKSPDIHYPTMTVDEIMALPVADLAATFSMLFLWVTVPHLVSGVDVLRRWGFDYVTNYVWPKDSIGPGYYARIQHEHLLVGKRGELPGPTPEDRVSSIIDGPTGEHSAKPESVIEMIERYYPGLPKIELFRRGRVRENWDAYGNEVEVEAKAEEG